MSWPWLQRVAQDHLRQLSMTGRFFSNEPVTAYKADYHAIYLVGREYTAECSKNRIPGTLIGAQPSWRDFTAEEPHEVPHLQCTCGLYTFKDELDARNYGSSATIRFPVLTVQLSGHVIEHERGYRSEKMLVLSRTLLEIYGHLHGGPMDDKIMVFNKSGPIKVPVIEERAFVPETDDFRALYLNDWAAAPEYTPSVKVDCHYDGLCYQYVKP